jgi:hypothetical protein
MVDLQFIEIRDVLKLTSVANVTGADPPTLLIRGVDFNSARDVYINDVLSPDVVITSSTSLLAQIPPTQAGIPVASIVVSSSRLTMTDRSFLVFGLGNSPGSVDGLTRLVQTFLKLMLQTPGSDIFAPSSGGGLLQAVGRLIGNPSRSTMVADFKRATDETRRQLISLQAGNPRLSMTERLLYARVIEARFVPKTLTLEGRIAFGNQAGQGSVVGLGL